MGGGGGATGARAHRPAIPGLAEAGFLTNESVFALTELPARLAVIGGGPVFRKAGRYPLYEPSELDRWAEARIGPPQRSTSEVDPA